MEKKEVREEDKLGLAGVSLFSSALRLVWTTSRALPAMLYALHDRPTGLHSRFWLYPPPSFGPMHYDQVGDLKAWGWGGRLVSHAQHSTGKMLKPCTVRQQILHTAGLAARCRAWNKRTGWAQGNKKRVVLDPGTCKGLM